MNEGSTIPVMSRINFRRLPKGDEVKLDFTHATNGIGKIHLYYAGKYVQTVNVNLTSKMEVKGMEMKHHG
jgi:hypothetical protein